MRYGVPYMGSLVADDTINKIMSDAQEAAAKEVSVQATNAATRVIGRLVKKPVAKMPDITPAKSAVKPAPPWFKYGLYGAAGLAVYMLLSGD